MAIKTKYIETYIKREVVLNHDDLKIIDEMEYFIDKIILEKRQREIWIELVYPSFSSSPLNGLYSYDHKKRKKMQEELEARYKKAGWSIEVKKNEEPDNVMFGTDFWILKF
jgi:hypothetical protein